MRLSPLVLAGAQSSRPFPAESGLVTVNGTRFLNNGKVWGWRGASMFMLPARFRRGEDISRQIAWMQAGGDNVARCFIGGIQWAPEWYGDFTDYRTPYADPDFEQWMDRFFRVMGAAGLRVEASVATQDRRDDEWRVTLQQVFDVASHHWNVFGQVSNEPWTRNCDPVAMMRGVNTYNVPWDYGIQPDAIGEEYQPCPVGTYLGPHLPRDRAHAHNGRDLKRMSELLNCPVVDDEYLGIADYSKAAPAARSNDLDWHVGHAITSMLFGAGYTKHSQFGIGGHVPSDPAVVVPDGATDVQPGQSDRICQAISAARTFLPVDVYTGEYSRAGEGFSNFPCVYNPGDSEVDHGYASILGNVAYAVIPLPTAQWGGLEAANGWTLDAVGPVPYVGRFVR